MTTINDLATTGPFFDYDQVEHTPGVPYWADGAEARPGADNCHGTAYDLYRADGYHLGCALHQATGWVFVEGAASDEITGAPVN